MDSSITTFFLDRSVSNSRVSDYFILLLCFIEIPTFNANSVDPDQMLHSPASDLALHCLPLTIFWVSRLKFIAHDVLFFYIYIIFWQTIHIKYQYLFFRKTKDVKLVCCSCGLTETRPGFL